MKEMDFKCQNCINYDNCELPSSHNCKNYEFYKCQDCVNRVVESDGIPKCFRGGIPCMVITNCENERRKPE